MAKVSVWEAGVLEREREREKEKEKLVRFQPCRIFWVSLH